MKIYVIRHGQTDWNLEGRMLTLEDIPLNENGITQAKKAKEIVDNLDYDLVISSPLKRTYQTAQIINQTNNKNIIVDDRIIERDAGPLSGLYTSEDIFKDYWKIDKNNLKYEGPESIEHLVNRVYDFINYVKKEYSNKNILIVTHNGVCRMIRAYFEGTKINEDIRGLGQDNCEIRMYKI